MTQTTGKDTYKSALYQGWVGHRRFKPKAHSFRYKVFMCYLDLDELDTVLAQSSLWSRRRFGLARFRRTDYFNTELNGEPDSDESDLKTAVLRKVNTQLGLKLEGSVRMLTNLRYFGFIMNPLTIYYCFDKHEILQALLLEVTNTPWAERHHYALRCDPDQPELRTCFSKEFHVSPFHDMNIDYEWRSSVPQEQLKVYMKNLQNLQSDGKVQQKIFDASLNLERLPITGSNMNRMLLAYPFMTLKVCISIYWQAMRLLLKRIPIYKHPVNIQEGKQGGIS